MYRSMFRLGRFLSVFLIIVLLLSYLINSIDLYEFAENRILSVLEANPGFEDRLTTYGNKAAEWKIFVRPEIAQAIISLGIDPLKSLGLWEEILKIAGAIPGGRAFLENIEKLSREIIALAESLDLVSQAPSTAVNLRKLRNSDTYIGKYGLEQIYNDSKMISEGLKGVSNGLESSSNYIRKVTGFPQISDVLTKLDEARAVAPTGFLKELADGIYNGINAWVDMPEMMNEIRNEINNDMETLRSIRNWYRAAEILDFLFDFIYLRSLANWVIARTGMLLALLAIFITMAVGGWTGSFLVQQAKRRDLTRPRKLIVDDKRQKRRIPKQTKPSRPHKDVEQSPPTTVNIYNIGKSESQQSILCNWANGKRVTFQLPKHGKITVGSNSSDEIQTSRKNSSQSQVIIKHGKYRYFIEVTSVAYPTILNGDKIVKARSVKNGDVLQVGDVSIVFLL